MANYQTYQTDYGFITIDADSEQPPKDFIAGPFPAVDENQQEITDQSQLIGVDIDIIDNTAVVTPMDGTV